MGRIKIDGHEFETDANNVIQAQTKLTVDGTEIVVDSIPVTLIKPLVKGVVPLKHYEILGTGPGDLIETAHRPDERYVEMLVTDEVGIEYIVNTKDYIVHRIQYGERDDLRDRTFEQVADVPGYKIGTQFWWE